MNETIGTSWDGVGDVNDLPNSIGSGLFGVGGW